MGGQQRGQSTSDENDGDDDISRMMVVLVSTRFMALTFTASCLVAFAVGHLARIVLIVNPQKEFLKVHGSNNHPVGHVFVASPTEAFTLPDPVLQVGKTPPITTYTSKNFNTALSSTTHSRWMVTEVGEQLDDRLLKVGGDAPQCRSSTNESCDDAGDEEEHLPAGQHLLIDIDHVDSDFLNSEERLANAMLDLVNECGLTLLSYHCHGLYPMGVSCAGVLLESHVSFHTWPTEGVITLDLFTCGPNSLLPIVPLAERLFAVPSETENAMNPKMIWAHKYRGFGDHESEELTDMFNFPVGQMNELKKEVSGVPTNSSLFSFVVCMTL